MLDFTPKSLYLTLKAKASVAAPLRVKIKVVVGQLFENFTAYFTIIY